jgi:hypothetical protein
MSAPYGIILLPPSRPNLLNLNQLSLLRIILVDEYNSALRIKSTINRNFRSKIFKTFLEFVMQLKDYDSNGLILYILEDGICRTMIPDKLIDLASPQYELTNQKSVIDNFLNEYNQPETYDYFLK